MANDYVWMYCGRCGAVEFAAKWWPRGMSYDESRALDAVAFMNQHLTWCRDRVFYAPGLPVAWDGALGTGPLWVRPINESEHWRLYQEAEAMGWVDKDQLDKTRSVERIAPDFVVT